MRMVMMICADNLGGRMFVFGRGMFAGHCVGGMQGARVGAVVRQCVAMSRHSRAARAVRRAATAQPCARATSTHVSAATTTTAMSTTTTAAAAASTTMPTAASASAASTTASTTSA
jgi:hypothetical protein